jgi:hypothetical protein
MLEVRLDVLDGLRLLVPDLCACIGKKRQLKRSESKKVARIEGCFGEFPLVKGEHGRQ